MIILVDSYRLKNDYKYLFLGSIFISIGSLLRYDLYIIFIPLIFILLFKEYEQFLHKRSLIKVLSLSIGLFLVSSLSLSIWATRDIKLGLPPLRNSFFSIHKEIKPEVIDWIKSWTINTYDLPKVFILTLEEF